MVLDPLRYFHRRILRVALALQQLGGEVVDARKQLRIERTDIAKDARRRGVAIRRVMSRVHNRVIQI